jgi:acyl carrier protein
MTVREKVFHIVARETERPLDELTDDTHLSSLGMDSLDYLDLLCLMDAEFEIDIPAETAALIVTLGGLVRGVELCL